MAGFFRVRGAPIVNKAALVGIHFAEKSSRILLVHLYSPPL
jgi:hypothetical protein